MSPITRVYDNFMLVHPKVGVRSRVYVASVTQGRVELTSCRMKLTVLRMERMGRRVKLSTRRMRVDFLVREVNQGACGPNALTIGVEMADVGN